ncbi:HEPN domain-containing protein [Nocardia cerradoensis]|uniref:HEPN domain-containing protein n=1 Tax=Nocardia cerradoensis TaxID=85688 RepID=UPI0011806E44|nr:HEPN domain-containing protein [Nocardia cerradoensis]
MPSPLFVSFQQTVTRLKTSLIVEYEDYGSYNPADYDRALGFRVLASAHLEEYVEKRCLDAMAAAVEGHLRGRSNRAAKCLIIWHAVTRGSEVIPLESADFSIPGVIENARDRYEKMVKSKHGINGSKLKSMIFPIGLRDAELDVELFSRLDTIADKRNLAAHTRIRRARTLTEPIEEWKAVEEILPILEKLDTAIGRASTP